MPLFVDDGFYGLFHHVPSALFRIDNSMMVGMGARSYAHVMAEMEGFEPSIPVLAGMLP